jgi:hypothetical protein
MVNTGMDGMIGWVGLFSEYCTKEVLTIAVRAAAFNPLPGPCLHGGIFLRHWAPI